MGRHNRLELPRARRDRRTATRSAFLHTASQIVPGYSTASQPLRAIGQVEMVSHREKRCAEGSGAFANDLRTNPNLVQAHYAIKYIFRIPPKSIACTSRSRGCEPLRRVLVSPDRTGPSRLACRSLETHAIVRKMAFRARRVSPNSRCCRGLRPRSSVPARRCDAILAF